MPENPETAPPTTEPEYASWPRRIGALVIDWIVCGLVTALVVGSHRYANDPATSWVVLGVYLLEATVGTAVAGGSFGQLVTGIRVWRTDGRPLNLLAALLRTFLICLVVPPLIFKPDSGRGLHDLATNAAAYRLPTR
jgi:uncharacterized RDD family membrane protein YckC